MKDYKNEETMLPDWMCMQEEYRKAKRETTLSFERRRKKKGFSCVYSFIKSGGSDP